MSQKAGNWIIAAGAVGMLFGLSALPAALGDSHDSSTLAVAACLFSLGSLTTAGGIYVKARALQVTPGSAAAAREAANSHRRPRGGCDACQAEVPVIQCTVHRVHLCASCLAQHYDFRSCAYMPTTRRAAARGSKSAAVRAGRA
jgi:hypothetical protein